MTTPFTNQTNICEHTWFTDFDYPPELDSGEELIVAHSSVSKVELRLKVSGTWVSTEASAGNKPSIKTDMIFLHHSGLLDFWVDKVRGKRGRGDKERALSRIEARFPLANPDAVVCPCWVNTIAGGLLFPSYEADWVFQKGSVRDIQVLIHHNISGHPSPLVFPILARADAIFLNHNGVKTYVKGWHTRGGNTTKGNSAEADSKKRIQEGKRIP